MPFGLNLFSTAETLPKEVAYSEPRLQPPNGYKDTTVPGDLGAGYAVVAPQHPAWLGCRAGHAGQQVGPITAGLLTPESLGELMGGPDIAPAPSGLQTPPGPPNAYNEHPGLPPAGVQRPGADPPAATGIGSGAGTGRSDARAGVAPAPNAGGPPLPAEARAGQ